MKRSFLMPHWCKIAGWILMVPLLALGILRLCNVDWAYDCFGIPGPFTTLLAASMLMVAFSRERDEDEYTASIRGRYLMLSFYIDFVFVAVTAFAVRDLDYLNIMALQMFLILFLHIVMFNVAMAVIRRRRSHEE